jgi:hypothetical protein
MTKVKAFTAFVLGSFMGAIFSKKIYDSKMSGVEKNKKYSSVYENWLVLKEDGKGLRYFFEKNKYKSVAIYGYARMGRILMAELKNLGIEVTYVVDKKNGFVIEGVDSYQPNQILPKADVMIVTPFTEYEDISRSLNGIFSGDVVALDDVVYECL